MTSSVLDAEVYILVWAGLSSHHVKPKHSLTLTLVSVSGELLNVGNNVLNDVTN